jgi:hypothetical protein
MGFQKFRITQLKWKSKGSHSLDRIEDGEVFTRSYEEADGLDAARLCLDGWQVGGFGVGDCGGLPTSYVPSGRRESARSGLGESWREAEPS